MPSTIMDLESSYVQEGADIRLAINSNDQLYVELKAVDKPSWKQETPIKFPKNQWVHVKAHYTLDQKEGTIQIWQDGKLIIDTVGKTIAANDLVYDRIEVGITANQQDTILYLDDFSISKEEN
jgi:hypothetical protein